MFIYIICMNKYYTYMYNYLKRNQLPNNSPISYDG